jgi:hypothetical protein
MGQTCLQRQVLSNGGLKYRRNAFARDRSNVIDTKSIKSLDVWIIPLTTFLVTILALKKSFGQPTSLEEYYICLAAVMVTHGPKWE